MLHKQCAVLMAAMQRRRKLTAYIVFVHAIGRFRNAVHLFSANTAWHAIQFSQALQRGCRSRYAT